MRATLAARGRESADLAIPVGRRKLGHRNGINACFRVLRIKKEFFFFKNEARKLLILKETCGKNSQNEAKTKLAKLLKTRDGQNNEAKTNLELRPLRPPWKTLPLPHG